MLCDSVSFLRLWSDYFVSLWMKNASMENGKSFPFCRRHYFSLFCYEIWLIDWCLTPCFFQYFSYHGVLWNMNTVVFLHMFTLHTIMPFIMLPLQVISTMKCLLAWQSLIYLYLFTFGIQSGDYLLYFVDLLGIILSLW